MTLNNIEKLNVNKIAPSMILAKDVLDADGKVLFPKDLMITRGTYNQLVKNNIKDVFVKLKSIDENAEPTAINNDIPTFNKILVSQKEEFKRFSKIYEKNSEEARSIILSIGNGEIIDIDKIYNITENVISSLDYKGDIVNFITYLENDDDSIFTHSTNVAMLCNLFAKWLDYSEEKTIMLTAAGMLHDIGKTKVNKEVLNKKGKLTKVEFEEIKNHAVYGFRILEHDGNLPLEIKLAALLHHEKIDGTGYPTGATGKNINDFAKIVAICDIYDAMTANRIYRDKLCPFDVINNFEVNVFGILEHHYLLIFLKNIAYSYLGLWVKLSDGSEGEVVFINGNELSKPMVKIKSKIVDLRLNRNLKIIEIL